jgi:prophage endopeptidase
VIALLKFWREGVIVALLLGLAWQQTRVANEKAAHQKTKAGHAVVLQDLANKTLVAYEAVVAEDAARKKAVAALDEKHTKELNDEKAKLARLQSDVASGRVGLRVNAHCTPAAGTDVPPAASTTRVADATGPRLTDAAERDYFALQGGIDTARKQIDGLQEYIREVCLK